MSQEPTYSLLFNVARVRKMIDHTRACESHSPTFGQCMEGRYRHSGKDWDQYRDGFENLGKDLDETKVPAGLHLVGDHGVYLMSNGAPIQQDPDFEKTRPIVDYALGIDPHTDEGWYEAKVMAFGGDDAAEFIEAEAFERAIEGKPDDDYVEIRISASRLAVMSDTVAKERAPRVALG